MRNSKGILLDSGRIRLAVLGLSILNIKDFIDWGHYIPENVVFWDDVSESFISIHYDKLIEVLVVPDNLIDSICDELDVMIGLRCWEEKIGFAILML